MRITTILASLGFLTLSLFFSGCGSKQLNVFSVEQDIELGKQVSQEIANNPKDYPLLPERGNEQIYSYIRGLTQDLLATGVVQHRREFAWEVNIIDDDETLNAFCTPGGYIYVYTGLIKFLDSEDQLIGVLGHEIAHADRRHSTQQLTKIYGLQTLASVVTGKTDPGLAQQIALGLASLSFSRAHETEADEYSVRYLCPTGYNAAGAAGFFKKMEDAARPPQFLSTHPNPGNRIEHIEAKSQELRCRGSETNREEYARVKQWLQ